MKLYDNTTEKKYDLQTMVLSNYMDIPCMPSDKEIETKEFQKWQKRKNKNMICGLVFLSLGFVFQIIGNWPC